MSICRESRAESRAPTGRSRPSTLDPRRARGFTLIELMVVVGIMGLILAMGIPSIYHAWHKESLQKATNDIRDVFRTAREQAIMRGEMTLLVIHPQARRLEVMGGAPAPAAKRDEFDEARPAPTTSATSLFSATWPETVALEMLDVNLSEYKDADVARVRFFPNGTSDEMTIILRSEKNEKRGISLEVTTGIASLLNEDDLQKLAYGGR